MGIIPWKRDRLWIPILIVILLLGFAGRALLATRNPFPSVDGVYYMEQSRQLVGTGNLPFSTFPPGWPILVAVPLVFFDGQDSLTLLKVTQLTNVIFGSLLPGLVFIFMRRRAGTIWGLLAAAMVVVLPMFVTLSKGDLSDMAYACFLLAGCLLARNRLGLMAGMVLGYTYLIRPEAALVAAGLWLLQVLGQRQIPWAFTAGMASWVLPNLIFIRTASGQWSLSSKGGFLSRSLSDHTLVEILTRYLDNAAEILRPLPIMVGWPLVVLALWGILTHRRREWLFLTPLLLIPLFDIPMAPRYLLPYLPFLFLAAFLGGRQIVRWFSQGFEGIKPVYGAVLFSLVVMVGFTMAVKRDFPRVRRTSESYYGLIEAGEWLSSTVEPETVVAAYKPYTSFWAGCRFVKFPDEVSTPAEALKDLKDQGAEYLVANVFSVTMFHKELMPLLSPVVPPEFEDQLTLVYRQRYKSEAQTTSIFRIH